MVTRKPPEKPFEYPAPPDAEPRPAAAGGSPGKKERVIHTRVPAVLEEELKRFAENLRVPVSNLIRTILEDAIAVADRAGDQVETQLRSAAEHLHAERARLARKIIRRDPLEGVFGFQPLKMNIHSACAQCGALITVGEDAYLGLTDEPGRRVLACANCVPGAQRGERP